MLNLMTKPNHALRHDVATGEGTDEEGELALDTRVPRLVRILNGALDEDPESPSAIVLNGRLDPATLRFLKVDSSYQRPLGNRADIWEALKGGAIVPNIDVGVRGQDFISDGDDFVIRSPAFIIDGWQRVGTALRILEQIPNHPLRIFATVHFGTTDLWERHRFTELNKNIRKVSPNLHLRNMRDGNEAILTLYGLSNNTREFALFKKVSWSQSKARGDLISATVLVKTAMRLHAHHTTINGSGVGGLAEALSRVILKVSLKTFRENVAAFFEIVDQCWGLRTIEFSRSASQVGTTFLYQLARVFSNHVDFWDVGEKVFFVSAETRRKLAKFPINDPHVKNLAGSGGAAANILYEMLCSHMDSGKRTGHMRARPADGRGRPTKSGT